MEAKNTKERIVEKALELFAQQGYEAVSVAQIAQGVGIKAPSLYKHYRSKQDIFNAIIDEMAVRYDTQMKNMMLDGSDPQKDIQAYRNIDVDTLVYMGKNLFLFFLQDKVLSQFRKLLTIEQYHNEHLATLYREQYFDSPLQYQSMLFAMLIQQGGMRECDPHVMAMHFYAPMYFLLMRCDETTYKEEEVMQKVEKHIRQFHMLYTVEKE